MRGESGEGTRTLRPCPSLELVLPPPAAVMIVSSSPGASRQGQQVLPTGSCEVVLHDPRNQKMVVWDPHIGLAHVQSTKPAVQVCPFCEQELPDSGMQWQDGEWCQQSEEAATYISPLYFSLIGAQLRRQTGAASADRPSPDPASQRRTLHSSLRPPLLAPPVCARDTQDTCSIQPVPPGASSSPECRAIVVSSANSSSRSPHRSPHRSLLLPAPLHQQPQAEDGSPIRDLSDHASTSLPLPAAAVPSQRAAWPLLPAPIPSQAVSRDGEGVDTESMAQAEAAGASPVSTVNGGRAVGGGEGGSGAGGHGLPHECLNYGYYAKFFHSVRRIGTGAYGSVYECRHVMDGVDLGRYAVKVCAVGDNRQWLRRVLGEVHNLQALQHENVVRYMHSWLEPFQSSPFSPLVPSLFILMNLANAGNLHSRLALDLPAHRRPCFSDDVIVQDMVDLMRGLEYLHSMRIIHRDLKPENVLVHQETPLQHSGTGGGARSHRLIISDLGQSQRFSSSAASRRTGCTGTVRFTAPEMLEECDLDGIIGNGGYSMRRQFVTSEWTYAADVWSLGAILYCLCFSAVPWEETEDLDDLATLIIQGGGVPRAAGGLSRSSSLMHLVDRTLTQDPAARPSLSALLNTPVIQQAIMVRRGSAAAAGLGENDDAAQGCQGQGSRVRRVPSELNLDSPLVRACVGAGGEAGSGGRGTAGNAGNAGTGVGALVTSALAASSRACAKGRAAAGGCDAQGRSEVGGYAVQQAQGASPLAPLAAVGRQRGGVEGEAGEVHVVRQNHQHRRSKPAATVVEDGFHRSILAVGRVRGAGGAGGLENRTPVRLLLMIVAFVVRGLMEGCLGAAHLAACLLDRLEDPRRQPQSQMSENEGLEDE